MAPVVTLSPATVYNRAFKFDVSLWAQPEVQSVFLTQCDTFQYHGYQKDHVNLENICVDQCEVQSFCISDDNNDDDVEDC